ncbi:hypothetical protein L682_03285 [Aquipseudomonas alcaligenes OT 69]|nr:hypothetical protein L682_03285 [Pseudomonas alcaligenes OT 69]
MTAITWRSREARITNPIAGHRWAPRSVNTFHAKEGSYFVITINKSAIAILYKVGDRPDFSVNANKTQIRNFLDQFVRCGAISNVVLEAFLDNRLQLFR